MNIPFWKMHGAGNDFILINGLSPDSPPVLSTTRIQSLCRPHTGIGADGLILVQPSDTTDAHFRMQFFNPDGHEASMCGNGARCVARFAHEQGLAPEQMQFLTQVGPVQASVQGSSVTLDMQKPHHIQLNQELQLNEKIVHYDFADTGVPHVVIACADIDDINLKEDGKQIRQHTRFAPEGTNVDFVEIQQNGSLRIRTYERGVEAETLACGTGVAAAAVTAYLQARVASPVHVHTAGGDTLIITLTRDDNQISKIQMTGPAEHVFHGHITLTT